MTGKLNAKELPTNLRFNQKLTIKSGEPILNQPELVPITLKRSKLILEYSFPNARIVLEKLTDELTTSLDKISKSEKMINSSMSDIGDQYRNQSEELQKLSAHFNNFSASMKEMNETYRLVGEKLEEIQGKINKHSVDMTDSSPVVKIKESLKNLQV